MRVKIKFKGKDILIEDVQKVSSVGKYTGLMFKPQETNALLFEFGKTRKAIHSFFCNPFLAVWTLEGKIVDYRIVKPFLPSIKPGCEFDRLIEIPLNNKYSEIISFFTEGKDLNSSSS